MSRSADESLTRTDHPSRRRGPRPLIAHHRATGNVLSGSPLTDSYPCLAVQFTVDRGRFDLVGFASRAAAGLRNSSTPTPRASNPADDRASHRRGCLSKLWGAMGAADVPRTVSLVAPAGG